MALTGVIETISAIAIAAPFAMTQRAGAAMLTATMLVGAGFHVLYDPPLAAAPAVALAIAAAFVGATAQPRSRRKGVHHG